MCNHTKLWNKKNALVGLCPIFGLFLHTTHRISQLGSQQLFYQDVSLKPQSGDRLPTPRYFVAFLNSSTQKKRQPFRNTSTCSYHIVLRSSGITIPCTWKSATRWVKSRFMANSIRWSIFLLGNLTIAHLVKYQSHFIETQMSSFLRQSVTEYHNVTDTRNFSLKPNSIYSNLVLMLPSLYSQINAMKAYV